MNSPDAEKSLCIGINYLDKSFFALSLGSPEEGLVVEENWNMTWNGIVLLTKAQYQQFLPLSPITLSAPIPGIPKWVYHQMVLTTPCSLGPLN